MTAEEIVNRYDCATWIPYNRVLELVRIAQNDGYNQALEDAKKVRVVTDFFSVEGKISILAYNELDKLKK